MADLLAVKRLTASDLTLFERLFRSRNVGNQKSINLNADVLTGVLYPRLAQYADTQPDGEISFPLTILGPDAAGPYRVRRKILKGDAYKNWRLNGEFIYDPEGEPGRFDALRAGDLGVFGFDGMVAPSAVTLLLLARDSREDAALHGVLDVHIPGGKRSMVALTSEQITEALRKSGSRRDHPLSILASDSQIEGALEDLAEGGSLGLDVIRRRRRGRPVSPGELARAKRAAERTGADGESLVDLYLSSLEDRGADELEHVWMSRTDAVSPYDFSCTSFGTSGRVAIDIDVKSTRGTFATPFHMSIGELAYAVASVRPYHVYRVSELSEGGAWLAVSNDLRDFCRALLSAHDRAMPGQIKADSFTVPTNSPGLTWDAPVRIYPPEDDDG